MAADHFCLIWNNFQNSILSALGNLQSSQDLVDVTLMCEGKNVRAHKVILSACSPYFRNLFKETPCQHPVIILKDVSHYDLTALLQFMYQGEVMVTQECLASFLKTAELLQISGLAGTSAAAQGGDLLDPDGPPRPPPDPSEPETSIKNTEISVTKKRGEKVEKEVNILPDIKFGEEDPQQSCSYVPPPTVLIKTESMDRDFDDMDTETTDMRDEDHYDNSSSHSEEPSILERSLKAQSDGTAAPKRKRKTREKLEASQCVKNMKWNSSLPAQCPYCLVYIKQARNMNRHIKYYCQNSGNSQLPNEMLGTGFEITLEELEPKKDGDMQSGDTSLTEKIKR